MTNLPELRRLLQKYDYDDSHSPHYAYGTAGFRFLAVELPPIMVRVGIAVAAVEGVAGVMITASHNTAEYNGVKLAGRTGGMIDAQQEQTAVEIVNDRDIEHLLQRSSKSHKIVYIGRDTREHSMHLSCLVQSAIRATDETIRIVNVGQVTTPQLHYLVRQASIVRGEISVPSMPSFVGMEGYDQSMIQAYRLLLATANDTVDNARGKVHVDCANGVGYQHLCRLQSLGLDCIVPRNGEGPLNEQCGSEYVQKNQLAPRWYDGDDPPQDVMYCASFDGDADRIVFFKNDILLDGDKIASLIGNFIRKQLDALETQATVSLGVVQTAYANGASTKYLREQQIRVVLAKTGVKYVHKAAHDSFDVGVYFEANGHGTVLFGDAYYHLLRDARPQTVEGRKALVRLNALPLLINQAVGDAISDLLVVDAILQIERITVEEWSHLYEDLPSKQSKVSVPDRTIIQTNDTETRCTKPDGLQAALDRAIAEHGDQARAFIRPSGTENVVRVYAEASANPEALAKAAEDIVRQFCSLSKI